MDKSILTPDEALARVRLSQQRARDKGPQNIHIHELNEYRVSKEGIVA